jgi:hypothetical protein
MQQSSLPADWSNASQGAQARSHAAITSVASSLYIALNLDYMCMDKQLHLSSLNTFPKHLEKGKQSEERTEKTSTIPT